MAELITFDDQSSLNLSQNSTQERAFQQYLYVLSDISIELSKTKNLDELYQKAIILANEKLGFERIGILRFDQTTQTMTGTWGIDTEGVARDESSFSLIIDDEVKHGIGALARKGKVCVWLNREIQEFSECKEENDNVGLGWNAAFAFWDGDKMLGWISCDNLLTSKEFLPYQSYILRIFGSMIGELILLKQAQQEILMLNSELEDKVLRRTHELNISQKKLQQSYQELEKKVLQRTKALASEKEKLQGTLDKLLNTEHSLEKSQQIQHFLTQDISSLTEMQEALQEANTRAEAANITKSRFIANISHELKTPMNIILGNLSLLASSASNEQQEHSINKANDASKNLLTLIEDLLKFSITSQQKDKLEIRKHCIDKLIDEVLSPFSEQATQKGINLICHIHRNVPTYLYCDATKLKSVLTNLLSNAIKFTLKGDVLLQLSWVENEIEFDHLQFLIKDTGIGFEKQHLKSLFHSFTQLDNSASRNFNGVGLGLALVQQYCQLMSAEIDVHSQIKKGSSFIINLPSSKSADIFEPLFEGTILVVSTHPIFNDLMARSKLNYQQVEHFPDAETAKQYKLILAEEAFVNATTETLKNLLVINHQQSIHPFIDHQMMMPYTARSLRRNIDAFLTSEPTQQRVEKKLSSTSNINDNDQKEALIQLLALCKNNDFEAIEQTNTLIKQHSENLNNELIASLTALQNHLQHFDFETAATLLDELCNR